MMSESCPVLSRPDPSPDKPEEEDEFSDVAKQLTKLAAEIPFTPPELETDAPDDVNVERMIGLLLRESGDQLNEKATSRLSALSPLPANRLLGHGARYLNEYFSSWVQEQGGYDAAFEDDEDEDEVQ
ncbi:hypothetical protein INR49_008270 [Caranx melampygus]|nr:hypothetical protein INR49_008270 [Caranx melampygus]